MNVTHGWNRTKWKVEPADRESPSNRFKVALKVDENGFLKKCNNLIIKCQAYTITTCDLFTVWTIEQVVLR
jgi:hypothetical protein